MVKFWVFSNDENDCCCTWRTLLPCELFVSVKKCPGKEKCPAIFSILSRKVSINKRLFLWIFIDVHAVVLTNFLANVPILHPLRTPENLCFSGIFRGYKREHWPEIGYKTNLFLVAFAYNWKLIWDLIEHLWWCFFLKMMNPVSR